jgi:hypothetical protein
MTMDYFDDRHRPKTMSPGYTLSWICYRCKRQQYNLEGAKFLYFGRYKRRVCASCLAERKPKAEPND